MSRVHVYGPPEDRALADDERLCTDGDADDAFVVFHPGAIMLGDGDWSCIACEVTSAVRTHEGPGIDPHRYNRERGHLG